jgi:phenylacetate-CoA ligase
MNTLIFLHMLWFYHRLRQRDHWTRQRLELHQQRSLRLLRDYAYNHSPFYSRFHKGLTDRPLQELPVLTKDLLMEHFNELVTDQAIHFEEVDRHVRTHQSNERFLGRYWVNATSGSQGSSGLFLFNYAEWINVLVYFARRNDWAGKKLDLTHRLKEGVVGTTIPWRMSAMADASTTSWWVQMLRLDASDPVNTIVEKLNEWQPEILSGFSSAIKILAEEQIANRLRISPEIIVSSAEILTSELREKVEKAWNRKPFNQYGATESGGLASECKQHKGLHIYEDLVIIEVVDKDNQPVPVGTYGNKILITVLFSRTLPLIRYELSDMMRISPLPCPCRRPYALINDIKGRLEAVLYFPTPAGEKIAVHHNIFHRVLERVPVAGWQVIQGYNELKVLLCGAQEAIKDELLVEALQRELATQKIIIPPIKIERVTTIPRIGSGKTPHVRFDSQMR